MVVVGMEDKCVQCHKHDIQDTPSLTAEDITHPTSISDMDETLKVDEYDSDDTIPYLSDSDDIIHDSQGDAMGPNTSDSTDLEAVQNDNDITFLLDRSARLRPAVLRTNANVISSHSTKANGDITPLLIKNTSKKL